MGLETLQNNNSSIAEIQPDAIDETIESDAPELKVSLAKAMCRQHIMWPIKGALPCEGGEPCDKQTQCIELAEGVLDYRRHLSTFSKPRR